ncbi:MAG: MFS transporter [Candidatus Binataceae bacterium]
MSVRTKTLEAQPPGMAPGLRGQIFSLDRILPTEPDSPRAWIIVFAAFLSMFTLFAVAYSFGAFVTPMAAEFHSGHAAISAIFSITAFIYFLFGAAAGHISDRIGPRPMMVASALFVGTGLVLTSSINHLWLSYLTYGIGVGIGVACGYAPMVAAVSGWFVRRRNTALGIAVSGIGFGTIVGAPLAAKFIPLYGWRETYVLFGAASASLLLLAAAMAKRSPIARSRSGPTTGEALRTPAFMLLYASSFLCSVPLFVPFVFLPGFARDLGVNAVASAALIGVIGIGSVCGRLGLGALADRLGLVGLYLFCFLLQALSYAIWLGAHSYLTLVIFALAIGTGYGGYVALAPAVLAQFFGTGNLGALVGSLYTSNAFGTLIGPPLAGFIIDHTGGYRWAIATALAMATAAFLVLLPLPKIEIPDPALQKVG